MQRKSGPRIPTAASFALSRNRSNFDSVVAGIFTQTDVQQQRKMVRRHDDRMSNVPRPLFGGTQPWVMLWCGEEEFIVRVEYDMEDHAIPSSFREQRTENFSSRCCLATALIQFRR